MMEIPIANTGDISLSVRRYDSGSTLSLVMAQRDDRGLWQEIEVKIDDNENTALRIALIKQLSDGAVAEQVKRIVGDVGDWNIFKE